MPTPRLLLVTMLAVAACTTESSPSPIPTATPIATPTPSSSASRARSIDDPIPGLVEWRIAAPDRTYEADATWNKAVVLQAVTDSNEPRDRVYVADLPDPTWRLAYQTEPFAHLERLTGGDAQWTFTQVRFAGPSVTYLAKHLDLSTGRVQTLGESTFPQGELGHIEQRARPTVVSDFGAIAWTQIRYAGAHPIWELRATERIDIGRPVQLIVTSSEPIVLLAMGAAVAFVIAHPDRDELIVHSLVTGVEWNWARASRVSAAAWTQSGLAIVRQRDAAFADVALTDSDGHERVIASGPSCRDLAAYDEYITWTCASTPRTDLRVYDSRSDRFFLVGRSAAARDYHVADRAFVWLEGDVDGGRTLHLAPLPL